MKLFGFSFLPSLVALMTLMMAECHVGLKLNLLKLKEDDFDEKWLWADLKVKLRFHSDVIKQQRIDAEKTEKGVILLLTAFNDLEKELTETKKKLVGELVTEREKNTELQNERLKLSNMLTQTEQELNRIIAAAEAKENK